MQQSVAYFEQEPHIWHAKQVWLAADICVCVCGGGGGGVIISNIAAVKFRILIILQR